MSNLVSWLVISSFNKFQYNGFVSSLPIVNSSYRGKGLYDDISYEVIPYKFYDGLVIEPIVFLPQWWDIQPFIVSIRLSWFKEVILTQTNQRTNSHK